MSGDAILNRAAPPAHFFRPRRLGHANLFVSNYERAQEFYHSVAGFHVVYQQPDNQSSFVSNGNTYHDLGLTDIHGKHGIKDKKPGLFHTAFEMETEAELVEGYRRAEAAGETFPRTRDHDVAHSLYRSDPEGNMVEIYADVIQDWRAARHGVIVKAKPEWIPGITNPPSTERNYPVDPEVQIVKDAVFHPKKVTHVALVAADFEAMYGFYTDIVGLTPFTGDAKSAFAILTGTCGIGDLTLLRQRPSLVPGFHHVGAMVWDEADLDRSLIALRGAGLKLEREINHPARRVVCVEDPDGIRLNFYVNRNWTAGTLAGLDPATAEHLL